MPCREKELRGLLIMREVRLRAPHRDSRTMKKEQIVQISQLKTAWKWDPKEMPDATVYRVCAEHGPEQVDEKIASDARVGRQGSQTCWISRNWGSSMGILWI